MVATRLTAYGRTATGGHASVDDACSDGADGAQIKAADDGAVYAYATADDEGTRIYLSKVSSVGSPSQLWLNSDGFAASTYIYVTAQSLSSPFSNITTAGTYQLYLDDDFPGGGSKAVYIGAMNASQTNNQPTECEEAGATYGYPSSFFDKSSDSGNDKQFQPMPDGQGTGEGVLIDRNKNINLDYKMRTSGTPVNQVPFILSGVGPQTLRGRSTSIYKCTTGDGDKE